MAYSLYKYNESFIHITLANGKILSFHTPTHDKTYLNGQDRQRIAVSINASA